MSVACLIRHSCSKRYNGCLGQSTARRRTLTSNSLRISTRESSSQASVRSSSSSYNIWIAPLAIESVYSVASFGHELIRTTRCEQHAIVSYPTRQKQPSISTPTFHIDASKWERLRKAIIRYWRAMKRIVQLSLTLAPVAILYPLARMMQSSTNDECEHLDAHEILLAQDLQKQHAQGFIGWYLRLCLSCVEYSGAAVIKLMQWAGSRPDLFGHDFCTVFSALQDHTTPHHKSHTVKVLKQAFGDDWESKITLGDILGSGCIGQVYKGYLPAKNNKPVAVKVLHPNAEPDMEADLDLMRAAVRVARWLPFDVFSNLKWLNLEGVVEEFADLLKLQLDLRTEAANLERFNQNFANQDDIIFPKLVSGYAATKDVLVETFVEGVPVLEYARKNAHNQAQLTTLCTTAIRAVCKMIFLDNMMHGDLHGGNVAINTTLGPKPKFVLYDVGIVAEYNDHDHQTIVDILAAFVRKQGRKAGRLMIDDSNQRLWQSQSGDRALDEERFIDKIEWLTVQASSPDYLMEHLGTYISYICSAAAEHHVMMNPSFISAALAVKVEEGIALALDPSVKISLVAIPVIIESESRRFGNKAKRRIGERLRHMRTRIFGPAANDGTDEATTGSRP